MTKPIEYVLWGLPKGSTERYDEVLLIGAVTDYRKIQRVKELASKDGFHSFREAAMYMDEKPNFAQAVTL